MKITLKKEAYQAVCGETSMTFGGPLVLWFYVPVNTIRVITETFFLT